MNNSPVAVIPAPAPESLGSAIRRSLAEHGVIIMKESRPIAHVPTTYGAALEIAGQIVVTIKDAARQLSVGVKFEQSETTSRLGSAAFVDSDELEEFLAAFNFIISSADQMAHDPRDYTEVMYATRDGLLVGFYQQGQKQQAFARLGVSSANTFFDIKALPTVRDAVVQAREHVTQRRAAWDPR